MNIYLVYEKEDYTVIGVFEDLDMLDEAQSKNDQPEWSKILVTHWDTETQVEIHVADIRKVDQTKFSFPNKTQ
jgi:hypothetical protein